MSEKIEVGLCNENLELTKLESLEWLVSFIIHFYYNQTSNSHTILLRKSTLKRPKMNQFGSKNSNLGQKISFFNNFSKFELWMFEITLFISFYHLKPLKTRKILKIQSCPKCRQIPQQNKQLMDSWLSSYAMKSRKTLL